ncbi:Para-aminobenzoate synthase component 1 [Leclercia adecarboxylata]|uniref:Para-aminobenzoate synthase component 1 n=1 Tax=Leclercia adecarboxylata TaxID=83655 RepID=A0A4U9HX85_9ENTR|nr:Para-aminobenzoate synthase component 1 [Leclercia adecarboxylata]
MPELFVVEPFPAVHHLVSTITARLPPAQTACDLLRAAFPGGSITGAPKVRAMENYRRAGATSPKRLVRQYRLSQSVRRDGTPALPSAP